LTSSPAESFLIGCCKCFTDTSTIKNITALPEWERVLTAAARLQRILPDAVRVGGTALALHAEHRRSQDADHVLADLRARFDEVLAQLASVAGWKTARVQRPVQILGSLDGIETGVRQLIRDKPLETTAVDLQGARIRKRLPASVRPMPTRPIVKRRCR
jgi:hypothetical protein